MAAKGNKFASGKWAWGICDICGIRAKLRTLRDEFVRGKNTHLMACETCWDPDHPQNFLDRAVTTDAQALQHARPDTGLQQSRQMFPPGNWVNGQPPTLEQQAVELAAERAAAWRAKAQAEAEERAWIEGNQAMQLGGSK